MAAMKMMDRGVSNFQAPTSVETPKKRVPVLTLAQDSFQGRREGSSQAGSAMADASGYEVLQ